LTYSGRIFDIVEISPKVAQIVLKKKINNKIQPVAICVFGYWRDKALNEMKLKVKDKIRGNLYLKSKPNGRSGYYTDVYFKEIFIVENAPTNMRELFVVDRETGEIIENENTNRNTNS
jgi:hypothetical protein